MDKRKRRALARHWGAMTGLVVLAILAAMSIAGVWLSGHDPHLMSGPRLAGPSGAHWLGTDDLGRDIFARICYGGRISLAIGVAAVTVSLFIGVPLGALAGYFGGWTDQAVSRVLEVMLALPTVLLAILIAIRMGRGMGTVIVAVGIVGIPQFARQVRASVLALKEQDFVQASRALGAPPLRTLFGEILPNALGPIIVLATLGVGSAILTAAGLSFLGLGVETGTPEWGAMLHDGRKAFRSSAHLAAFSGMAISVAVLAINLFGDGLRDALDPKSDRRG